MVSKKAQKMRGRRTHGYGSHKKHRGAGSRGGRGMTGAKAHKFVKYLKEKPGHIGKYGFVSKSSTRINTINLYELEKLSEKLGKNEINLKGLKYQKVLGKGSIKKALIVYADAFSAKARKKLENAGGKAVGLSARTENVGDL